MVGASAVTFPTHKYQKNEGQIESVHDVVQSKWNDTNTKSGIIITLALYTLCRKPSKIVGTYYVFAAIFS